MGDKIELKDAIGALRRDLTAAIAEAQDEKLRFGVQKVTVSLELAAEQTVQGTAGIKFWLMNLGTEAKVGTVRTHTITLELTPETADGPVRTGAADKPK